MPRFANEQALHANQDLLNLLQEQAAEKGCTMAQLALAWILSRRPWIVPIPGTTKTSRLEENMGAVDVTFTPADLHALDQKLEKIQESMVEK